MEHMEIDQIVDVPDTPDRFTASCVAQKYDGDPDVVDEKYVNEKMERGCPIAEIGKNRSLVFNPLENSNSDGMNNCSNFIAAPPLKKFYLSHNAPLFQKAQNDKIFGRETTHSPELEKMKRGKAICTNFRSKSSDHGSVDFLDLTEENGPPEQFKPDFSFDGLKDNATEDKKHLKESIGSSSPLIPVSSNTSCNAFKGKCKIDNDTLPGHDVYVGCEEIINIPGDSQQKTEKQMSMSPHAFRAPRVSGQKRLVRNGCISPHNIIARAKQSAEENSHRTNNVEESHTGHAVSGNTMSLINANDIVSEERASIRAKGKEVLRHPSSTSAHDTGITYSSSSPLINNEEANDTRHALESSLKCSGRMDGWRTTHNHRNINQQTGRHLRQNNDTRSVTSAQYRNILDRGDNGSSKSIKDVWGPLEDSADHATSLLFSDVDQLTGPCPRADMLTKRQRKHGSTSRNSSEVPDNSEIICLGSSGKSSNPGSSRSTVLDPEVVELLSETRYTNRVSQDTDDTNIDDSDARARQVEADEILARELQEQLYHEDSFEVGEIDEHLASELQHEEELLHTSDDNHQILLSTMPSNRQPRSQSYQNPSNRRRAVPQAPLSNRMSQLRSRIVHRSPMPNVPSRGRRFHFPLDMNVEVRIDILEALEDAVGDLGDMEVADDIIQAQHDFDENNYELLLALDENNHQHAGASANQINSLPQSTVQTDNFDEACAICLETPVKGETIRHLPCLHKFHKDCIDPWLRRKTTCPVCKSSVT